jgi:hypothetical protein
MENTGIFPVSPRGQRNGRRAPYLFDPHPHPLPHPGIERTGFPAARGSSMTKKWDFPLVIHIGEEKIIVHDVHESMILLDQIPGRKRGPIFQMALRHCEAFRRGAVSEKSCQIVVQAALTEGGLLSS